MLGVATREASANELSFINNGLISVNTGSAPPSPLFPVYARLWWIYVLTGTGPPTSGPNWISEDDVLAVYRPVGAESSLGDLMIPQFGTIPGAGPPPSALPG